MIEEIYISKNLEILGCYSKKDGLAYLDGNTKIAFIVNVSSSEDHSTSVKSLEIYGVNGTPLLIGRIKTLTERISSSYLRNLIQEIKK